MINLFEDSDLPLNSFPFHRVSKLILLIHLKSEVLLRLTILNQLDRCVGPLADLLAYYVGIKTPKKRWGIDLSGVR